MLESILLTIISIFSAVGIIFTLKYIFTDFKACLNPRSYIVVSVKNCGNNIEGIIRLLMKSHPGSEIMIFDCGSEDDTKDIIEKLETDFENVHKAGNCME